MKKIPIGGKAGKGKFIIVDDEDFKRFGRLNFNTVKGYAVYGGNKKDGKFKSSYLHRMILGVEDNPGLLVDHINHDPLDNRKKNLRVCTQAQNQHNCLPRGGTSTFKGVCLVKNMKERKWRAQIGIGGKKVCLGFFTTEIEAAKAYDEAARQLFEEFAWLNFPKVNH